MFPLHRDSKQALRIKRILLGVIAYVMWMAVGLYLHWLGMLNLELRWLLLYFALMLVNNLIFLLIVRFDWNLRFHDPGMTFAQIACGILWGIFMLAFAVPEARGGMLLVFVTGFFFGVFRLSTREFLVLLTLAATAYGGLILHEWNALNAAQRQLEISQWIFLTLVMLWMSFMGGYVSRLRSNLRQALTRIEELAHRDALTGTRNRRSITGSLEQALEQAAGSGAPLSACILDLDHFKRVNDRHGHLVGDEVLRQFVSRVESRLRSADFLHVDQPRARDGEGPLGRFGGEEFLVILPGTDLEGARRAAERIREAVAATPFDTEAGPVPITVSIGVTAHRAGDSMDELLSRADQALYQSKQDGRNRVTVIA